jgi:hypothetical protein
MSCAGAKLPSPIISLHGDFFGNGEISDVEQCLVGCVMQEDALLRALADIPIHTYCGGLDAHRFAELLCM